MPRLHKEIMQIRPEEGLECYHGDLQLPSYQDHSIASEDRQASQNCGEDTRENIRGHSGAPWTERTHHFHHWHGILSMFN